MFNTITTNVKPMFDILGNYHKLNAIFKNLKKLFFISASKYEITKIKKTEERRTIT